MGEAERIFRSEERDSKRDMIKRIWPELYDALNGLENGKPNRTVFCAVGDPEHIKGRHIATGRVTRMGHPACSSCLARLADRPGGWPLPAADNLKGEDGK